MQAKLSTYIFITGAANFMIAFAIGITTDANTSPKAKVNAVAVASRLFTSFFSIFFCILHHKPKPSYDREKHPSNNLNMQFSAGSHARLKRFPKLNEQHVILIFISPPLCIYQTTRYICCISQIGVLLMSYPCFTSFTCKLALSIYIDHHTTVIPAILPTWPSLYAKSYAICHKVAQRVEYVPYKVQRAKQRSDTSQDHTHHAKYNPGRFNHLKASFTQSLCWIRWI